MPWCPKCRQEFQDTIRVCPTCNEALVDELAPELVTTAIEFFSEEAANQFLAFLEYSNIEHVQSVKDESLEIYRIQCQEKDLREIGKLFSAYRSAEEENEENAESDSKTDDEHDNEKSTSSLTPYVKKKDQYSDTLGTGIMLIVIGALGIGYVFLNYMNVLHLLNGSISYALNICLFSAGLIYGFISLGHASKLKTQIAEEEQVHDEILGWLDTQVTKDFLEENMDPNLPQEANDLKQFQIIKKMTMDQYSEVKENFIEAIVDEKLSSLQ